MSLSRWSQYLNRSSQVLRDSIMPIVRMSGTDALPTGPRTVLKFQTAEDMMQYATGCDSDVGGRSSVHLSLENDPEDAGVRANGGQAYARFWGDMRTSVRPGLEKRVRGGYAGFRNKHRSSLFGELTEDFSNHRYLALRVRASGHPRTRTSYYVNLQTDGPVTTDLWQHRLYFRRDDGGWEDLLIPFDAFVLTNSGEVTEVEMEMHRQRVRSVGISLLGGNSGVEGAYELGIDSISLVNEEGHATAKELEKEPKPEDQENPLASPVIPPLPGTIPTKPN